MLGRPNGLYTPEAFMRLRLGPNFEAFTDVKATRARTLTLSLSLSLSLSLTHTHTHTKQEAAHTREVKRLVRKAER